MSRFHINPVTGTAGVCSAKNVCPFGGQDEHFDSIEDARANYEQYMIGHTVPEITSRDLNREFLIAEAEREVLRGGVVEDPVVTASRLLAQESLKTEFLVSETIARDTKSKLTMARDALATAQEKLYQSNDAYTNDARTSLTGVPSDEIIAIYDQAEDAAEAARSALLEIEAQREQQLLDKRNELVSQASFLKDAESWTHYSPRIASVFANAGKTLHEIEQLTDWKDEQSVLEAGRMIEELHDRLNEQGFDAITTDEDPSPYWSAAGVISPILENYWND